VRPAQRVQARAARRLDESHKFEARPSLSPRVQSDVELDKAEMDRRKNLADENNTEERQKNTRKSPTAGPAWPRAVGDRRETKDHRPPTTSQPRGDRRARQMPGREKEVWTTTQQCQCAGPASCADYEDKVVDFILELANVTEKKVIARRPL